MNANANAGGNLSGEEVAAAVPAAAGGKAAAAKRKDLMTNIKSRMNANAYNIAGQGKKNEKELAAKVKFFEKKQADGTFKEYMRPRMEEARTLLERVKTLRATPLVARAPAANGGELVEAPLLKAPRARPAAKTKKAKANAPAANNAAGAAAAAPAKEKPKTLRAKTPKPPKAAPLAPIAENAEGEEENVAYSPSNFVENNQGTNTFLRREAAKALPLPVFHNPYTGRKFKPDEDPMPPIKKAYRELKKLRKNVYARAETQRSIARVKLGMGANGSTRRRKTRRSRK